MGTDPEKIAVTREDVLTALARHPDSLRTVADVAHSVITNVYNVERVYDGKTAMWHVHQADLKRLLADMVADGALVKRTGEDWEKHGAPTWLGRPNGHYYVVPEQAHKWEQKAEEQRAKERQETADRLARGRLVVNHPHEYARLVDEYLAAYDRTTSTEGGQ
jgi:alkanesulfonate monooxygenase SsuD/methylene tetrahydromethanopterin reductase-like flavin-dependent oxidoreductase (luciferase family)